MNDKRPWSWGEDGKLTLQVEGKGPQKFTVIPGDPRRVARLERELKRAHEIAGILRDGVSNFREGKAEYGDAVRRLNKLLDEWDRATMILFQIAIRIGEFIKEPEFKACFEISDIDALMEIAVEIIDRLTEAAVKAATAPQAVEPPPAREQKPEDAEAKR